MHFLNLITVDIPTITPEPEVDARIQEDLKRLKEIKTDKDFMADYYIEKLNSRSNAFGRRVDTEIDIKLEPYYEQTENPDYLEFDDYTEELRKEYETGKTDCIKFPGGKYYSVDHRMVRNKFIIGEDGLVYQKDFGPLHHPKRSKRAKKMTAFKDFPYKKMYKTFDAFAQKERYFDYNEDFKGYGYLCNPNAFYDWYQIGGRWPFVFLVKDTCEEYSIGERSWGIHEVPPSPDGYRWVCAARKKDIQWKVMFERSKENAVKNFRALEKGFAEGKIPEGWYGNITENGISGFMEMLYVKGETVQQYLARHRIIRKYKYPSFPYGYLDDQGEYHSEDSMPSRDEKKAKRMWHKKVNRFIDALSDDTVLVGVDCHI